MKQQYIWMKVTRDKYELPVAVANTASELARIVGTTKNAVVSSVSHLEHGHKKYSSYVRIRLEDEAC